MRSLELHNKFGVKPSIDNAKRTAGNPKLLTAIIRFSSLPQKPKYSF